MATKKDQPDQTQTQQTQQTTTAQDQDQPVDYNAMSLPELQAQYEHTYGNSAPLAGDVDEEDARRQIIDALNSGQPIEPAGGEE